MIVATPTAIGRATPLDRPAQVRHRQDPPEVPERQDRLDRAPGPPALLDRLDPQQAVERDRQALQDPLEPTRISSASAHRTRPVTFWLEEPYPSSSTVQRAEASFDQVPPRSHCRVPVLGKFTGW